MSGTGVHQPESSETGLTFVRPMPQAQRAYTDSSQFNVPDMASLDVMKRLFPPRSMEDSGAVGPVTGLELGHFVIEERIGRGGMGAVFRAIDRRLDRVVALKVLSPEHSSDPEAVQRFQNEARSAAKLDHDNISRVHYIGEENGLYFIAFEFVTGTNVRNFILQKGKLSPHDAVNYTLQIAEALRQTAAANVVHRDIKPSNIIISPTGRAKLVDLGLARHNAADASKDLTVAGTTLGTFDYIAPEQAMDARNVDVRTDIYSLGCTLYHMLTGEPPYPKGTMFEKVMNHHSPTPPDASLKNPRVSPQLVRVVQKMMASNPDERYSSPEALISDLVLIASSLGLQPTPPEAVVWSTPLFKQHSPIWDATRTWIIAGLALLLIALMMDQWSIVSYSSVDEPSDLLALETPIETLPGNVNNSPQVAVPVEKIPERTTTIQPTVAELASANGTKATRQALLKSGQPQIDLQKTLAATIVGTTKLLQVSEAAVQTKAPDTLVIPVVPEIIVPAEIKFPFTVITSGQDPKPFHTLSAACAAAASNSVIEIQEGAVIPVQTESLKIANKRIKLRPQGNHRPLLRFEIAQSPISSSFSRTARMINLSHAALEMYDIDLQLVVNPESLAELWTMLSLSEESEFLARGCSFTLLNLDQIPAAFICLPEHESGELIDIMPDRMKLKPSHVSLSECVLRGQGDFFLQQQSDTSHASLKDVALAITGTMFRINGFENLNSTMNQDEDNLVSIKMQQVTAVIGEELLMMASGDHGAIPTVEFDVNDSLFRQAESAQTFISISGHEDYELLVRKLLWRDSSETNFLQSTGVFCKIDSPTILDEIQELNTESFGITNVQQVTKNMLALPMTTVPAKMSSVQPVNFQLQNGSDNPGLNATSDGRNAGVDWTLSRIPGVLPPTR